MTDMSEDLIARLMGVQVYYKDDKAVKRRRNPDGPAAAATIIELEAQLAEARESERATVVAWLRNIPPASLANAEWHALAVAARYAYANFIEAGDHLT